MYGVGWGPWSLWPGPYVLHCLGLAVSLLIPEFMKVREGLLGRTLAPHIIWKVFGANQVLKFVTIHLKKGQKKDSLKFII